MRAKCSPSATPPRRGDSVRGSPCGEPARLRFTSLRPPSCGRFAADGRRTPQGGPAQRGARLNRRKATRFDRDQAWRTTTGDRRPGKGTTGTFAGRSREAASDIASTELPEAQRLPGSSFGYVTVFIYRCTGGVAP